MKDVKMASWIRLVCLVFLPLATTIRHEQNLIWAQTPAARLTVSRLVGIEGDPSSWVVSKKPNVKHISAPHYRWEFKGLGFSYRKQLLVWSESMNKRIQSLMLNGSTETTDVFPGTSSQVVGIAVDWLSGNVYWGDEMYNWIMMCPLIQPPGKHVSRIVLQDEIDNPHGLAVYPNKGLLFFTEWGVRPRIEVCDLLGKNRRILVDTKVQHPRGIAVSIAEDRLYWVDSDLDTVESVLFDGTGRKLVISDLNTNFFGIALFENYIFVTDQENGVLKVLQQDKEAVSFTLGNIPYGIVMYDESQQPGDPGPCDTLGCEHVCVLNATTDPVCLCGGGYDLMDDNIHCELSKQFVHPSHLYAIDVAICQYPANVPDMSLENVTLTSQCFLNDRFGYLALTFDARENMLYYSGNNTKTISAIPLEIGANAKVVAGGTGVVKGLAFDWITGNLFWTDSTNAYIKVSRKDGAFQRVLVEDDVNSPLGIAVHPGKGKIFWTDTGFPPDVMPKVEMANTDGTERKVIMADDGVGMPNHMFLDVNKNELYWADSALGIVRRYYIDSGDFDVYFQMKAVKFYGISLFRDFILWTDTDDMNGIHIARLDLGRKVRGIIHPKYGVAADVITFDVTLQPNITSPCDDNNCEQLCLASGNSSYRCACGLGFTLAEDNRKCDSQLVDDNFLLVNDAYQKQIYQVNTKNGVVSALGLQTQHEPIALDFNPVTSHVYWSDNTAHVLARTGLRAGKSEIVRRFSPRSVCDGIAVDYINGLLFYTDTGRDIIGVTNVMNTDYHATVIKEALDEPRDIVVSPTDGLIFWSDWGKEPRIARALMDGSDIRTIVNFTQSAWPNGLALDVRGRTLYYADAQDNAIGTYHIDTAEHRLMVKEPSAHYFGLFVMGDFLYLTDWRRNFIGRMHKQGGVVMNFGPSNFTKLYGVSGFNSSEILLGVSACRNNTCDHICVPKPMNVQQCLCSDDFMLIKGRCISVLPTSTTTPAPNSTTPIISTTTTTTTTTTTSTITTTTKVPPTTTSRTTHKLYQSTEPTVSSGDDDEHTPTANHVQSTLTTANHVQSTLTTEAGTRTTDNNTGNRRPYPKPDDTDFPLARPSTTKSSDRTTIIAIVTVSVVAVIIIAVIVAVALYRRRRGYTVPHAKLNEDTSSTGAFPTVFYPHREQDTVTFDSGIENPTYDITQAMLQDA